ncbi:uncharacterized protein MKK02DRAFT_38368 [Dioszegia hungarica]|uniref:Uncharacterized protein n=1 Tax=Dioszegia hungarica TaxID=4972 RepID=A0AA38H4M1_9TREE|nr:uncharacterized protein MKK02DRAFT_38368 [Dioszegia hungarica]KAI9633710.1 hypothetical protein MKK02DRAFT_38368 [Dioszegia hungarica]
MSRYLAWGSNITGSLDPLSGDQTIREPRDVTGSIGSSGIVWTGWASTVARTADGLKMWGGSPLNDPGPFTDLALGAVKRVLGFDSVLAYLDGEGYVRNFEGQKSAQAWNDVTISGLGVVFAFKHDAGVCFFPTLDDLFSPTSRSETPLSYPTLNPSHPASLYSMESRAFLHSAGPMHQLFEIISDDRGKPCPPRLELIEDLEGMEFHIVPGARNRLGIVTTAGEAYVLDKRSVEVELVEAPGDVRLLGLGSDFEVVVTEQEEVFTSLASSD